MGNDFIASLKQEICDHVCDFIPESYWIETELKWSFSILWGDLVNFKWLKNERTKNNKNSNLNNQIGSIGVGAGGGNFISLHKLLNIRLKFKNLKKRSKFETF